MSICMAPTYKLDKLNNLFIELTAKNCNQRCKNCYIDFPLNNLNLNKIVCGFDKNNNIYDCFAICQHYGEMEGGHYTAVCKNIDGNWYSYNDSSVSSTSASSASTACNV